MVELADEARAGAQRAQAKGYALPVAPVAPVAGAAL
jgi:hypothetical protein